MSICMPRVIALRLQPATYATPLADLLGYLGFMVDMNMRIYVSSTNSERLNSAMHRPTCKCTCQSFDVWSVSNKTALWEDDRENSDDHIHVHTFHRGVQVQRRACPSGIVAVGSIHVSL